MKLREYTYILLLRAAMKNPDVKAMKPAAKDDSGKASSLLCFEALCYYCLVVI